MNHDHAHHHDAATRPGDLPAAAPSTAQGLPHGEELDPANQEIAGALKKSFRILKMLMFLLVILYFLSGWFSVKPNEVGLKLRYGRIVGADSRGSGAAVLGPGWHWSWPYPFERWITVSTSEREMPVEFMFQLTDQERATGSIHEPRYGTLAPTRDDYLITGDINILHASLAVKYRVTEAVAYVRNVFPMQDPTAGSRSSEFRRFPEYTILQNLIRDSVIETAAGRDALDIRGPKQDAFLIAVGVRVNQRLTELALAGAGLGISIDPSTGVLAPKQQDIEAIMPPRQTQGVFDQVYAAQTAKAVAITKAESEAQERLYNVAGRDYSPLVDSIDEEFRLMRQLSSAELSGATEGDPAGMTRADVAEIRTQLAASRERSEELLSQASGEVRAVMNVAQIRRDQIIQEAKADHDQFLTVLPEYQRNPDVFRARRLIDMYAQAMDDPRIGKVLLPRDHRQVRLTIQRAGMLTPVVEDSGKLPGNIDPTKLEISRKR